MILIKMIERELDTPVYFLIKDLRNGYFDYHLLEHHGPLYHDLKGGYHEGQDPILDAVLQDMDISYDLPDVRGKEKAVSETAFFPALSFHPTRPSLPSFSTISSSSAHRGSYRKCPALLARLLADVDDQLYQPSVMPLPSAPAFHFVLQYRRCHRGNSLVFFQQVECLSGDFRSAGAHPSGCWSGHRVEEHRQSGRIEVAVHFLE